MATKTTETAAEKKTTAKKTTAKKTKVAAKPTKNLLIIESPNKIKSIKKILGSKYEVLSSKGHIRDLPSSRLGVDVENNFEPEYIVSRKDGKSAVLKELKAAAAASKHVYLATDPDREGEAIAWHLATLLGLDPQDNIRVTFNEVTKSAVIAGVENPKGINMNRVSAQQARRVLDRIVGYKLSPFLWKKVKTGLSAGRVQSVATKLIVDREREIEAFDPEEYWTLEAVFAKANKEWVANFFGTTDGKLPINSKEEMDKLLSDLDGTAYSISSVKKTERVRQPNPPFTTSSLQQEASARLNMRPQRAMSIAQNLYEGIDVKGRGAVGLITYMRTDSLRVSDEARISAENFIKETYGANFYPAQPRVFKTRASAQDAHEAIRPTDVTLTPAILRESLTTEQYRLYKMIWERFVASQMAAALYQGTSVDVSAKGKNSGTEYIFRASDSKLVFPGFTAVYNYGDDEEKSSKRLPELAIGDPADLRKLEPEQKFTQPPSRYTEGSLVKALEEYGIGRPSTFATIVGTIIERRYVEKDGKLLRPTSLGNVTTDVLTENFSNIVDIAFTAGMESELDEIEEGNKSYLDTMNGFYGGFAEDLSAAEKKLDGVRVEVPDEESDVICDKCGSKMVYKVSRFGRFLACPNYPTCKNTKSIIVETEGNCPICGGKIIVRRSKAGKTYYACEKANECGFMTWDMPTKEKCPQCGSTLFRKFNRLYCQKDGCGYEGKVERKQTEEAK
ncbi:MAG: type I DNA topoisomerase [Clostridia bacterium]|nr:type I DNA topoisomerase [Clostridia bacterium]